jgi:peptide methionine sulfoxide reductase MsrB
MPVTALNIYCTKVSTKPSVAEYRKLAEAVAALTPEQYRVTQKSGTERAGTGAVLDNRDPGIYVDVVSLERSLPRRKV